MSLGVVLFEPRIPPNTGNIVRLCAAAGASLHLIEPLGFSLDDHEVRRAALDYWDDIDVWVHAGWSEFRDAISPHRCLYFSSHGRASHLEAPYALNSMLVFGSETDGLPTAIREEHSDRLFRIPMRTGVRNLNLATTVGIVVYEAVRQLGLDLEAPLDI